MKPSLITDKPRLISFNLRSIYKKFPGRNLIVAITLILMPEKQLDFGDTL